MLFFLQMEDILNPQLCKVCTVWRVHLKAYNSQLLVNLSSRCYWSITLWAPSSSTARLQGSKNISYKHLQFSPMRLSVTDSYVGQRSKWKSSKSRAIKWGCPERLIGLCCLGLFIQMIGCLFGNVYSNWKGHLACHRIKVRSDCQHAIWDCPSQRWQFVSHDLQTARQI